MKTLVRLLFVITFVPYFAACTRATTLSSSSAITIRIPIDSHMADALPTGRTACYGINVRGSSIPLVKGNNCSPATGLLAGYVSAGQDLSVTVGGGQTVDIDLYMLLMPQGSTAACPTLSSAFTTTQASNTFLIASATGVSVNAPTVTVDMTVKFPGLADNLVQQMSLPTTCDAGTTPTLPASPYSASAGDQTVTGTGMRLHGHLGSSYQRSNLTGPGLKMIVR